VRNCDVLRLFLKISLRQTDTGIIAYILHLALKTVKVLILNPKVSIIKTNDTTN